MLDNISSPADIKNLSIEKLQLLAEEIRQHIILATSRYGGHLASNLGVVELTIALHYIFHSPDDKLIWDVSHQTYTHKILTGRKDRFIGFSNPDESEHDLFRLGHTSSAIGLACGLAKSRELSGDAYDIIAVIGDAALDGGPAFEGLNICRELNGRVIIVVNDNQMSIPENYGGLHRHLQRLRSTALEEKDNFFRSLGFEYHFIPDGHDIKSLVSVFREVACNPDGRPVLVHVCTQKGHGYAHAEKEPEKWHWTRPFDIQAGTFKTEVSASNYGTIVGDYLLEKMRRDPKLVVVTASTPICIGFDEEHRQAAGRQYLDVGIAEQNAVLMAAGLARAGMHPIFATNSTFLQRAYDQIENEVCINRLPVVFIVTHGGVFGHGNDTHAGLYDIPLLSHIPNLTYLAPAYKEEYLAMLDWSIGGGANGPVAIRVPWTGVYTSGIVSQKQFNTPIYRSMQNGSDVAILALGSFFQLGKSVSEELSRNGIHPTLINPLFITGYDMESLDCIAKDHRLLVTLEDGVTDGGFGAHIASYYSSGGPHVLIFGVHPPVPAYFTATELLDKNGLSVSSICAKILDTLRYIQGSPA